MGKNGKQRSRSNHPGTAGVVAGQWCQSTVGTYRRLEGFCSSFGTKARLPEEQGLETHPDVPSLFQRSCPGSSGGVGLFLRAGPGFCIRPLL